MKDKYLIFTLEYPPFKGGVGKYYEKLVQYFEGEVFVLTNPIKEDIVNRDTSKEIRKLITTKWLRPRWLPALKSLYQTLKDKNINHVIVGHILPLGIVTYYLSKKLNFKYSIVLHGMDFALVMSNLNKHNISKKILKNADKIICANNYTAKLVEMFDESLKDKLSVVNPGVDSSFVRDPKRIEEFKNQYNLKDKKILFSLGRLVKRKGFDMVIKAMPKALEKEKDLVYLIGGVGPDEKYLKEELKKLPEEMQKKVIFLGKVSDEDRWACLELCDIFIMPSRNIDGDFEGFGIVYLEANLVGKPVIAGDNGGVSDAVLNNVNGLLVDPENLDELTGAIVKLSQDEELRNELGSQGNRMAVESRTWKKQIKKFMKIIKD